MQNAPELSLTGRFDFQDLAEVLGMIAIMVATRTPNAIATYK
jgi:hypothetical protein